MEQINNGIPCPVCSRIYHPHKLGCRVASMTEKLTRERDDARSENQRLRGLLREAAGGLDPDTNVSLLIDIRKQLEGER